MILSETKVGWIGAGKMGFPMSHCLLKSGVEMVGPETIFFFYD